jgi:hypothetical protein
MKKDWELLHVRLGVSQTVAVRRLSWHTIGAFD